MAPAAAQSGCVQTVTLWVADAACAWSYPEYTGSSGDGATWTTVPHCAVGGQAVCHEVERCEENGEEGILSDVFRDGVDVGDVCVPRTESPTPVPVLAAAEFKRLEWPASDLVIQPPDGRTLVNFETIFFTTNSTPHVHEASLVGGQVQLEIQATATSWIWHFGDGVDQTTSTPGHPYPGHDLVHIYNATGDVKPSVDTVYTGSYRAVGETEWRALPDTVTVEGETAALEIVEAIPQLVEQ